MFIFYFKSLSIFIIPYLPVPLSLLFLGLFLLFSCKLWIVICGIFRCLVIFGMMPYIKIGTVLSGFYDLPLKNDDVHFGRQLNYLWISFVGVVQRLLNLTTNVWPFWGGGGARWGGAADCLSSSHDFSTSTGQNSNILFCSLWMLGIVQFLIFQQFFAWPYRVSPYACPY